MFSLEVDYLVILEQHKDRLRAIEYQRLFHAAGLQQIVKVKAHQKAISWLGARMVAWGAKLQSYALSVNIAGETQ